MQTNTLISLAIARYQQDIQAELNKRNTTHLAESNSTEVVSFAANTYIMYYIYNGKSSVISSVLMLWSGGRNFVLARSICHLS